MRNIVHVLRKHALVRLFFTVVLSLAMAVIIGPGLHPAGSIDQPAFQPAPARFQQPAANSQGASPGKAASAGLASQAAPDDNISGLDVALKNLGDLQRDRASATKPTNGGATNNAATNNPSNSTSEQKDKSAAVSEKNVIQPSQINPVTKK